MSAEEGVTIKRVQDLGDTTYCGEHYQGESKREMFNKKQFAQKGCPAGCSCTHIFEKSNVIFGQNI